MRACPATIRSQDKDPALKRCNVATCQQRCRHFKADVFETSSFPTAEPLRLPLAIKKQFIGEILGPYKPHAQYLKSAEITHFQARNSAERNSNETGLIKGRGRFSIPYSCYIDDTGHFNAVEFNLCYNQLAYVLFGKCLDANIFKNLRVEGANVSFVDFKRHQLASMFIASIESRYYKMLKSDDFTGELTINRISASRGAYFCFTSIAFADNEGVKAKGSVKLVFAPPKA